MATVEQFDLVRLKDGRKGTVVDIYDDPPGYEIDFYVDYAPEKDPPEPWFAGVKADEIEAVFKDEWRPAE